MARQAEATLFALAVPPQLVECRIRLKVRCFRGDKFTIINIQLKLAENFGQPLRLEER